MQATQTTIPAGVVLRGALEPRFDEVIEPAALAFLGGLHRRFDATRKALLSARAERQARLDAGEPLDFVAETRAIREGHWQVAPPPADLLERKVEITGPTDRKMIINALNSGAHVFMADFEDANAPTWHNLVSGQLNLIDLANGTLSLDEGGKQYRLNDRTAVAVVRPRGWHLPEKHLLIDGEPIAASLFDFGLFLFHYSRSRRAGADRGRPYFYLPKLESHLEARLWNDVFDYAEDDLELPRGTIRATVLIETIPAAFEMDEILYELREHCVGLNAGRWDYIFSMIKKLHGASDWVFPDRMQVTMTVPFMRAYTELLVATCHRRGAHAIGGMAAFIPNRRDPKANEIALGKVREDKVREVTDGFDGTWVAHPDLVPIALDVFDAALGPRPNQVDRLRDDVVVTAAQLVDPTVPGGTTTQAGFERNVSVGVRYLASWLRGVGAVALYNLMEDAATAEIARSQVWQWVQRSTKLAEGTVVTADLVSTTVADELERIRAEVGDAAFSDGRYEEAARIFERVALGEEFVDFLTLPAYELLDEQTEPNTKTEGVQHVRD